MKKILVIGASNSKTSINKAFATYVANQIDDITMIVADLNELELPIYSPDLEAEIGIPENAQKFSNMIENANGIILSLAEYNGMITAVFKNIWDWTSRLDMKLWKNKPMLLMAVSPGGRGGINALTITKDLLPYFGGNVITDFSLGVYQKNFQNGVLVNDEKQLELKEKIALFQQAI